MAGRPPGRDWPALKTEFVTGDHSLSEMCRQHHIPEHSMSAHAARQHWQLEREQFGMAAAEALHAKILEQTISAQMPSLLEIDLQYIAHARETCARLRKCVDRLEATGKLDLATMQRAEAISSEIYQNCKTAAGAEFATPPETTATSRIDAMRDDEVMAELRRLRKLIPDEELMGSRR